MCCGPSPGRHGTAGGERLNAMLDWGSDIICLGQVGPVRGRGGGLKEFLVSALCSLSASLSKTGSWLDRPPEPVPAGPKTPEPSVAKSKRDVAPAGTVPAPSERPPQGGWPTAATPLQSIGRKRSPWQKPRPAAPARPSERGHPRGGPACSLAALSLSRPSPCD